MRGVVLLLAACGPSVNPARQEIDRQRASAPVASEGWTCPMHPDVHEDGPGTCPKCGMALEAAWRR